MPNIEVTDGRGSARRNTLHTSMQASSSSSRPEPGGVCVVSIMRGASYRDGPYPGAALRANKVAYCKRCGYRCILLEEDGSGWRLTLADTPEEPMLDFDGRPIRRSFGSDVLAGCPDLSIGAAELPESGLRFNDQGTPVALSASLMFELEAGDRKDSIKVAVSASTGRVSINRN